MSFKAIFPCKNVLTFVTRKSFEIMSIHNYAWLKSSLWLVVDCNNNSNVNSQKQDSGRLLSFQTLFVFTKLTGIFYLSFYGITLLSYGMFVYFWKLRELFILLPWNNTVILFIQKQNLSCSSNKWINFVLRANWIEMM